MPLPCCNGVEGRRANDRGRLPSDSENPKDLKIVLTLHSG